MTSEKALQLAAMYNALTESAKEKLSDLINDLLGKTAQGIIAYIKEPSDENEAAYDQPPEVLEGHHQVPRY